MKDRVSKYPGRVKLAPVSGQENVYDLTWADEPTQTGTPLNKMSLLSDATAQKLRITLDDPTVSDALAAGADMYSIVTTAERAPTAADAYKAGDFWVDKSGTEYNVYISLYDDAGDLTWYALHTEKRRLKSVAFTESTVWDVPREALGQAATVHVYGGGGCRYYNASGAGGGGGGYMSTWTGMLSQPQYTITIGAGGISSSASRNGGTSSFGTIVSAAGGSASTSAAGGKGGSGGGGGIAGSSVGDGGDGEQFGGGGAAARSSSSTAAATRGTPGTGKTGTPVAPYYDEGLEKWVSPGGNGVNTVSENIASVGKGTGLGGDGISDLSNAVYGAGGGGYGGAGGAGGSSGAGGGGGYGVGNYGAGGGGQSDTTANGKDGIVVVMYYGW